MSKELDIPKYHQTIDFDALMETAREHITALAGDIWSDHNSSDPGITQLEVLAFCIADLSYRTSFGIDDILAGYKGGKMTPYDLPLADVALPNNPVTVKDLRKILIDLNHPTESDRLLLRNAFPIIAEATEIPFFAVSPDGKETFLSYRDTQLFEGLEVIEPYESVEVLNPRDEKVVALKNVQKSADASNQNSASSATNSKKEHTIEGNNRPFGYTGREKDYKFVDRLNLNGLYAIQLEFEDGNRINVDGADNPRDVWDLNQNYFEQIIHTPVGNEYTISVLLPYWDDIKWSLKDVDFPNTNLAYALRERKNAPDEDYFIGVDKLNYDDYFYDYYAELDLDEHLITAFIKLKTKQTSAITVNGKVAEFEVDFLDWNELSNGVKRNYNLANPQPANVQTAIQLIDNVSIDKNEYVFDIRATFKFPKNGADKTINLLTRIIFKAGTIFTESEIGTVKAELELQYKALYIEQIQIEAEIFKIIADENASIYQNYQAKIRKVFSYIYGGNTNIWSHIGKYRNLCEDYSKFTASRVQEIALFGKLIVSSGFNLNELLGEVYFQVDQFLHPLVKFKTLSQMTEKGYAFDDLFNGPSLTHGFVEDADLENLKRRSVVYTSDLIRIIMDVPGVEAVEDFSISSYIDNRLMGRNVINCLSLTNAEIYKPRLGFEKSGLEICVKGEMEALDPIHLQQWYIQKLADFKSDQLPGNTGVNLSLPLGEDMEIEKYHSIQNDFPDLYGIGSYGLPSDTTEERKANAKQLKAYLLPFEQLMANYLKQIAHLPELFSFNRTLDKTYAFQPLYEVPDVQPLFQGFVQSNDTWETFKLDIDNSYKTALQDTESKDETRGRRSRFLSQLLSRFGESFAEYSRQMFDRNKGLLNDPSQIGNYQIERGKTLDKLIDDKIAFGEDYQEVSSQRYRAFDTTEILAYQKPGVWSNDNIESYKLRLCRLLGIEQVNNTFLFAAGVDDDGHTIDLEGIHIVEHILLRPRVNTASLLDINNRRNDDSGISVYDADKDPYSFKISVVLPRYAGRFNEEPFRKFTEHLIRMETPAHILIDFKWMSRECGRKFEADYSEWKKNIHYLKPFFFQNMEDNEELNENGLKVNIPVGIRDGFITADGKVKKLKLRKNEAFEVAKNSPERLGANLANIEKMKGNLQENKALEVSNNSLGTADAESMNAKKEQRSLKENKALEILKSSQKMIVSASGNTSKAANPVNHLPIDKLPVIRKFKKEPSILVLQDNLVARLNTPCTLVLKVYDFNETNMPRRGYSIKFEDKTTDIYNIRVSEVGGLLTLYRWDITSDGWLSQLEVKPVNSVYFNVSEFIANGQGLTTANGGQGAYKLRYQLDDGREVEEIIQVTKAIIPVKIHIGIKDEVMLDFDTEKDGLFRISNKRWKNYFLEFYPLSDPSSESGIQGLVHISSPYKGLSPTLLSGGKKGLGNVFFSDIYAEYGTGTYRITYSLDGQTTFADIELFLELAIHVFDGEIRLIKNQNGIIEVPSGIQIIDLVLDVPGGTLKVYDLDGVSEYRGNNKSELDSNPFGTVDFYKKVDAVQIERERNPIYQDGHRYEFVYEQAGQVVREIILFKAVEAKIPLIKLFENGKEMLEEPFVLFANDKAYTYQIQFHPKGAKVEAWVFDADGTQRFIGDDDFFIEQDYATEELDALDLFDEFGEGPIYVSATNSAGQALLGFSMKYVQKEVLPEITIWENGAQMEFEPFLLFPDKKEYAFRLNVGNGKFVISTPDGKEIWVEDNVSEENPIVYPDLMSLYHETGETNFIASYYTEEGDTELHFSLGIKKDPVVENTLLIKDLSSGEEVLPIDKTYKLVYDYKDKKKAFELTFGNSLGELKIIDEEGQKTIIPIKGKSVIFNGIDALPKGLATGDYSAIYTTDDGQTLEFNFNVINLNPIFELKKVYYKSPNYLAQAIPKYPTARTYIWRINGKYVSRSKFPELAFNFRSSESITVELTMHLDDYEAAYSMTVTADQIKEMLSAKK